jgi:FkbM family methyltransferase
MRKTKECKHGTFTYYTNDFWIGGALDVTGEYSEEEVQKLLSLIDKNSIVVEVGANIGSITVPMAKKAAQLYAFEPQPDTFKLLEGNIAQNTLQGHTTVFPIALSDTEGEAAITAVDYDGIKINGGAASISDDAREGSIRVKTATLDDTFIELGRMDLLKIDVEGHEIEVLKGGTETIKRLRPLIYVENDRPEKSQELIGKLFDLGYECFWHFPSLFNPDPMIHDDSFTSVNMLCKPKEKTYPASVTFGLQRIMSEVDDWSLAFGRMKPSAPAVSTKGNTWACVVRLGGVGDNLIASSVFPALKKKWGNLEVICAEPQHVVFENNPHIDKLTVKAQGDPPWENGSDWQKYWLARSREYAFFANLSHTCEVHRALTKAQTSYYWPASMRRKMCGQSYLETVADVCEVDYKDIEPRFYPTEKEVAAALETKRLVGGRYIGWVLTGSRLDKIWPPAAMVIGRIVKELGIPVIMFGAPGKDFEIAKVIQKYLIQANGSDKDVHLACSVNPDRPNWPVRRILTQTMFSDVVVTPDTGPAWAVAKEAMPKIVLLSHASKENITKHWDNTITLHADPARVPCWPCHLLIEEQADCERLSGVTGETGSACISSIAPDTVFENVKKALNTKSIPMLQAAE